MTLRDAHVPAERLTVLALGTAESTNREDQAALAHAAGCETCGRELARLTAGFDGLRVEAVRQADAAFDEPALELQRMRILDRLAYLGKTARVLPFPGAAAARNAPTGAINRRWISAAAAAGLLIGVATGQLLHLTATDRAQHAQSAPAPGLTRPATPGVVPASISVSDEELLGEIDVAVQRIRATELLATLDALTPSAGEIR